MLQARGGHDPESPCQVPLSLFLTLVSQNRFVYDGTLKDSHSYQNARFGSSIASVQDLNQDSYNDVVVGAPLEDNHRGVIYIFHGFQGNILKTPKQVMPPLPGRRMELGLGVLVAHTPSSHRKRELASNQNFEMGAFVFKPFPSPLWIPSPCLTLSPQQQQHNPKDPNLTGPHMYSCN